MPLLVYWIVVPGGKNVRAVADVIEKTHFTGRDSTGRGHGNRAAKTRAKEDFLLFSSFDKLIKPIPPQSRSRRLYLHWKQDLCL